MIAFLDLNRLNSPYIDIFQRRLETFVSREYFVLGQAVTRFEEEWAHYTQSRFAAGTGSGFDALYLIFEAYKSLGKLKEGDEVIVPANTYVATILPVIKSRLRPVLAEPGPDLNLDASRLERLITPKTKVILPVHLYGRSAHLSEINKIAEAYGLLVVDDAAQAHGALHHRKKIGGLTDATAWSFYPTKNLGALGDGGAVTSNDQELIARIKVLRNYGQTEKYNSAYRGINSRLDTLQAVFLSEKLKDLDKLNKKRMHIARKYREHIRNEAIEKLPCPPEGEHVYHQFVVLAERRDALREYLQRKGIQTLVHYPVPPHKQGGLRGLVKGTFPVSERLSRKILSLPVDPYLSEQETDYIIETINAF